MGASDTHFCSTCNEWIGFPHPLGSLHACPPKWDVWCPEYGQTAEDHPAEPIMARLGEDAAKLWAQRSDSDSADYLIVGGSDATVCVREHGTEGPIVRYVVSGETVPQYSARQVPA